MAWFDRNAGGKREPEKPDKKPDAVPSDPEPTPVVAAPSPRVEPKPAPVPVEPQLVGHLYKGSRVTGQLTFQGPARIDGSVEGEIQCQGTLTVGEGAEVRAKISGQVVIIRGKVEGNVAAKEKLELAAPARLFGNIDTPRLIITEGVVFDGDCSMGVAKQTVGVTGLQSVSADKATASRTPKLQADSEK
jgi:cytoskeletal protein CcmA (bactofilin family)